jgi:DNA-binding CsgD family transcriptional regulator
MLRPDPETLIPEIYEAAIDPEIWPEVLARTARLTDASATMIGLVPKVRMSAGVIWGHNFEAASISGFLQDGVVDRSVFVHSLTVLPPGQIADLTARGPDLVRRDPGARSLLLPQGYTEGLFSAAFHGMGHISGLACVNEARRGPLPPHAAARLGVLMPHLARAMALTARLQRLEHESRLLAQATCAVSLGVISVTPELQVGFVNAEAERILMRAGDGIALRAGRLTLRRPGRQARLWGSVLRIAAGRADPAGLYVFVPRPSGAPDYAIFIGPQAEGMARAGIPGALGTVATLFLTDPTSPASLPPAVALADCFGLTEAEAQVARLAAMGRGMPFVADTLGVSLNTVRTHLKAVYAKVGVNHQAALARTIATRFPLLRGGSGPAGGADGPAGGADGA